MNRNPALSLIDTAAAGLRGIWAVMMSGLGLFSPVRIEQVPHALMPDDQAIEEWVSGIFHKLEELLAQFRAGQLQPAQALAGSECAAPAVVPEMHQRANGGDAARGCVADPTVSMEGDAGVAAEMFSQRDLQSSECELPRAASAQAVQSPSPTAEIGAFFAGWRRFVGVSGVLFQNGLAGPRMSTA